jgi:hypothetical protein
MGGAWEGQNVFCPYGVVHGQSLRPDKNEIDPRRGNKYFAQRCFAQDNHFAQIKMKSTIVAGGAGVARGEGKMFFAPT